MLPDRVSNPGPLTYESGALPIALRGPAIFMKLYQCMHHINMMCHEQGRQLLHFWFLNYFPLTRFHIVNRVWAITPKLYGIYS